MTINTMDKNFMQGITFDLNPRNLISNLVAGGVLAMTALGAMAQDTTAPKAPAAAAAPPPSFEELEARAPLIQRYPAGSITTDAAAAKALEEAEQDKGAAGIRYILDQRACYKKFLVSSCLEDAKEKKRLTDKSIKQVEIEANTFQRQATVDERDRSLAEQHKNDEADAARRLQEQKDKEISSAQKVKESQAKQQELGRRVEQNKNVPADYRQREHDAKIQQQQAEEAAKAPERAANAAQRQQRIKDAEAHRLEVERKKAENERERAQRKQEQEQQRLQEQQQQQQQAPAAK